MKFATAGDTVKIWNSDLTQVDELNNLTKPLPSICWSPNNSYLAQLSYAENQIFITYFQKELTTRVIEGDETKNNTCLHIDSTSRSLMAAGSNGFIRVWDVATLKLKKTYQAANSSFTAASYSNDDSVIAAANQNGDVLFFNSLSSVCSVASLADPSAAAIKQLKYSKVKGNLVATADDGGCVNIWDSTARKNLYSFGTVHTSPTSGVAFSPINKMLLLSCGLDKRIVLFDVISRKTLKSIVADEGLSSLDLLLDGHSVLAGTIKGRLLLYDLRNSSKPVSVVDAHQGPVCCVCVQASHSSQTSKPRRKTQPLKESNSSHQATPASNKTQSPDITIFSPCQQENISTLDLASSLAKDNINNKTFNNNTFNNSNNNITFNNTNNNTNINNKNNNNNSFSFMNNSLHSNKRTSDGASSIFSPISSSMSQHNSSADMQNTSLNFTSDLPDLTHLNFSKITEKQENNHSPMKIILEDSHNHVDNNDEDNNNNSLSNNITEDMNIISKPFQQNPTNHSSNNIVSNINKDSNIIDHSIDQKIEHKNFNRHVTPADVTSANHRPRDMTMEMMRMMVREEVEDVVDPLRKAILNMHHDMILQGHQIRVELQKMATEQQKIQNQLVQSLYKLEEENENLKFRLDYLS